MAFFLKNCKNYSVGSGWRLCSQKNLSNSAFSNCSKNVQNVIQMALKWLNFFEKVVTIAQWLGLCLMPHRGKLLFCTRSSQPTIFKIVITRFWISKSCNDATITAKPSLTITKLTAIGYGLLFKKFKPPSKISLCAPWWYSQTTSKYMSLKYLLISKLVPKLVPFKKLSFWGSILRGFLGVTPKSFRRRNRVCSSTTLHKN